SRRGMGVGQASRPRVRVSGRPGRRAAVHLRFRAIPRRNPRLGLSAPDRHRRAPDKIDRGLEEPRLMKNAGVVVPLAQGFEEIEAITIVDVLRRAGETVAVAGLRPGPCTGSHGIAVATDCSIDEVDPKSVKMVVLPG